MDKSKQGKQNKFFPSALSTASDLKMKLAVRKIAILPVFVPIAIAKYYYERQILQSFLLFQEH